MDIDLLINLAASGIRLGAPLLFAALGGIICERSGVLNIGLEGLLITGTFGGYVGALLTQNPWMGALGGTLAGGLMAFIFGVMAVHYRGDQVVLGMGVNIFALGATSFFYRAMYRGGLSQFFPGFKVWPIPILSDIPVVGPIFFRQVPLVYLVYVFIPLTTYILFRTTWGLKLRAVGEHPLAADTAGIPVVRYRMVAVVISGMLAGLGGAYLSVGQLSAFTEGLVAGKGFIALAAVIFGRWHPVRAALGCLIFGLADALQLRLQGIGVPISSDFLLMFPYLLTLVTFVIFVHRVKPPAALGKPYETNK